MTNSFRSGLAALAVLGLVSANPAFAAGATRSAAALPMVGASVGSVAYAKGAEDNWKCAPVTDAPLKLKDVYVQVDEAGRVVLDPKGVPFTCRAPSEAYKVGGRGGFPFEILLGIVGVGGLVALLAGGGSKDSTG